MRFRRFVTLTFQPSPLFPLQRGPPTNVRQRPRLHARGKTDQPQLVPVSVPDSTTSLLFRVVTNARARVNNARASLDLER